MTFSGLLLGFVIGDRYRFNFFLANDNFGRAAIVVARPLSLSISLTVH
jgi:hypothetical protein